MRRRKTKNERAAVAAPAEDLFDVQMRSFAAAKGGRLNADWQASAASQDSELASDLTTLRNRSRQMIRDNPHAANLKRIIQNNVVGTGIGIQCQIERADGTPDQELNDRIENAWEEWCEKETCHVAGRLSLNDMLRLAIGNVFQDGEFLVRKVQQSFGGGPIPFALEIIEPDLLMDQGVGFFRTTENATVRLGVEVNEWMRPQAYWLRRVHPGDYSFAANPSSVELRRIDASEIEHIYLVDRWPQTRGVPWMHNVLQRLRQMASYTESELVAARAAANIVGFIQQDLESADIDALRSQKKNAGNFVKSAPGTFQRLLPGEQFSGFAPNRPNANLDGFMRYMLREVASGIGVSYETLSRDYSQSNYSSSRLALLDDRDTWRVLQGWLVRNLLRPIYREWLRAAVLCGAIPIPDFFARQSFYEKAVRFKTRGWSWVDPSKEVKAMKDAVDYGFMSNSSVISQIGNGQDYEDILQERRADRDLEEWYGESSISDPEPNGKQEAVLPKEAMAPNTGAAGEEETTDDRE
jgi:lambda family phage portal protein